MDYIVGQRWVSHADAELGLGIVVALDERRITVSFPAVGEERTYAAHNAPLTRLRFQREDRVQTVDGRELRIIAVLERAGLLSYTGVDDAGSEYQISELELDPFVRLTTPQQRLLNGHFDSHSEFALRVATCEHVNRLQRSPTRGLLGSRTSLLAHQVYIAGEVGQRHAPRVMLADEVGLGKTIEAGMIIHQQLLTGRSQRVLIMVPAPLLHQWLVEMLRRFNLYFSLFDDERLAQYTEENPFEAEQLVLCSTDLFRDDPLARESALAASWDMVVIDEAHHLHWSENNPGEDYLFARALAEQSAGLLLLTATPEQVGQESHFARLQLLDAARFSDRQAFQDDEQRYRHWSALIDDIEAGNIPEDLPPGISTAEGPEGIIAQILDRHGTGRVLFRNTRASVGGFPKRILHAYPLPLPQAVATEPGSTFDPLRAIYPERAASDERWLESDPRVSWLTSTLRELRPQKALIICAGAETAVALEHHLHLRAGIRSAAFHEHLSIIERDRAAAYFADDHGGAQTLVCSEIGSEGRNFQFAQHLILFDLPLNPDLLEQRIGRLDRIGQRHDVHIHVPYVQETGQETLFRWLHEGMDIFRESCSAGQMVFGTFRERLRAQLLQPDEDFDALLEATRALVVATKRELREGRDRLLERNSCKPEVAQALIGSISADEDSDTLQAYFERLCDTFGVDHEFHSPRSLILRPTEHMIGAQFPHLPDEGRTVTFDREVALAREDLAFLTWEHPMVSESMDSILSTELGNAALGTIALKGVAAGTLLLEAIFTVHCSAPQHLQVQRFLSLSPMRILIDDRGRDLSRVMPHEKLNELVTRLPRSTALAVIKQVQKEVDSHLTKAEEMAGRALADILQGAGEHAQSFIGAELARLSALQQVNPQIRQAEIDHLQWQLTATSEAIARASLQLQAVRLIVST